MSKAYSDWQPTSNLRWLCHERDDFHPTLQQEWRRTKVTWWGYTAEVETDWRDVETVRKYIL